MNFIQHNFIFFSSFITALVVTIVATPLCILLLKKIKLLDDPKKHIHPAILHKTPIPRGGGLPLFIGILIASLFFIPINSVTISLLVASFIALAVGILDDKYDISPYIRFLSNFLVAGIVVSSGIAINYITNPLGGIFHLNILDLPILSAFSFLSVANILAVIWIVWVMNMLNWSKGVDGQMPGVVAISALVIGILSLRFSVIDTNSLVSAQLSFIIAGASIGFLIYNFYPARIFPGYGATAVYVLLSAVSILSGAKLATAILVMGVPMADGIFTIVRRILSGKSPFWHDKKHLHHLLLKLKWGQRKIALFYWIISAILGAISLLLTSQGKAYAIIMLIVIVGGILVFLHLILDNENEEKIY